MHTQRQVTENRLHFFPTEQVRILSKCPLPDLICVIASSTQNLQFFGSLIHGLNYNCVAVLRWKNKVGESISIRTVRIRSI